jgi:hypothetical protein
LLHFFHWSFCVAFMEWKFVAVWEWHDILNKSPTNSAFFVTICTQTQTTPYIQASSDSWIITLDQLKCEISRNEGNHSTPALHPNYPWHIDSEWIWNRRQSANAYTEMSQRELNWLSGFSVQTSLIFLRACCIKRSSHNQNISTLVYFKHVTWHHLQPAAPVQSSKNGRWKRVYCTKAF